MVQLQQPAPSDGVGRSSYSFEHAVNSRFPQISSENGARYEPYVKAASSEPLSAVEEMKKGKFVKPLPPSASRGHFALGGGSSLRRLAALEKLQINFEVRTTNEDLVSLTQTRLALLASGSPKISGDFVANLDEELTSRGQQPVKLDINRLSFEEPVMVLSPDADFATQAPMTVSISTDIATTTPAAAIVVTIGRGGGDDDGVPKKKSETSTLVTPQILGYTGMGVLGVFLMTVCMFCMHLRKNPNVSSLRSMRPGSSITVNIGKGKSLVIENDELKAHDIMAYLQNLNDIGDEPSSKKYHKSVSGISDASDASEHRRKKKKGRFNRMLGGRVPSRVISTLSFGAMDRISEGSSGSSSDSDSASASSMSGSDSGSQSESGVSTVSYSSTGTGMTSKTSMSMLEAPHLSGMTATDHAKLNNIQKL
jgi:hypothetical protein